MLRTGTNNTNLRMGWSVDDRTAACRNAAEARRMPVRKENNTYTSDAGAYKKETKKIMRHAMIPREAIFATRVIHTGCLSESVSPIEVIFAQSTFPIVRLAHHQPSGATNTVYRRAQGVLYTRGTYIDLRREKFELIFGTLADLGTSIAVGNKFQNVFAKRTNLGSRFGEAKAEIKKVFRL
jgi:hypothetical protein